MAPETEYSHVQRDALLVGAGAMERFCGSDYFAGLRAEWDRFNDSNKESHEGQGRFHAAALKGFVWWLAADEGRESGYLSPQDTVRWFHTRLKEEGYERELVPHPFLDSIDGLTVPSSVRLSQYESKSQVVEAIYAYRQKKSGKQRNELGFLCNAFLAQKTDFSELFNPYARLTLVIPKNVYANGSIPREVANISNVSMKGLPWTVGKIIREMNSSYSVAVA